MIPTTVYIVVSRQTGVPLAVYSTQEAADADVAVVSDGRVVESWVLHDGYSVTVGKWRG